MEGAGKKPVGGTIVALFAKANILCNLEGPSYSAKQKRKTICFKVSLYYLIWPKSIGSVSCLSCFPEWTQNADTMSKFIVFIYSE